MLEIRRRACCGTERDLVEGAAAQGKRDEGCHSRTHLETAVRKVFVVHSIAREVCQRPERESPAPGGRESADGPTGSDV